MPLELSSICQSKISGPSSPCCFTVPTFPVFDVRSITRCFVSGCSLSAGGVRAHAWGGGGGGGGGARVGEDDGALVPRIPVVRCRARRRLFRARSSRRPSWRRHARRCA